MNRAGRSTRDSRWANHPLQTETKVSGLLVVFVLVMHGTMGNSPVATILDACIFFACTLMARWPRGVAVVVAVLLAAIIMRPAGTMSLGEYAVAIPVFSAAVRGRTTLALASASGYFVLLVIDSLFRYQGVHIVASIVVWATFLAIAFIPGWFLAQAHARQVRTQQQRQADERAEVARELHDGVASSLSRILLRTRVAQSEQTVAMDDVDFITTEASASLWQLRQLVQLLRSPATGTDSGAAGTGSGAGATIIEESAERLRQNGFVVATSIHRANEGWTDAVGAVLRAVAHEAANNVIQHGDPAHPCTLSLNQSGAVASLVLSNAVTPTPTPATRHATYGLTGMRERLEAVGGLLEAGPENGTWVLRAIVATGPSPHETTHSKDGAR